MNHTKPLDNEFAFDKYKISSWRVSFKCSGSWIKTGTHMMRPLLFYANNNNYLQDTSHQKFLEELLGVGVETYPVAEHIAEYDHTIPESCWCRIPDNNDPIWPKLYFNPERADICEMRKARFVAKGSDIFKLTLNDIHAKFGTNISGPGSWDD
jgi:hypothetical protein